MSSERPGSVWSVLRNPAFRVIWIASMFSHVGSFLHETAAVWTMASITTTPLWVSLMQSALSLPLFLIGIPSGALADLTSPRRVLLRSEAYLAIIALILTALAILQRVDAPVLLFVTLLLGVGMAFAMPSWQALLPDLVKRDELPNAVALNGLSINLSRAVGPAVAGLLISLGGPALCFMLNAASYLLIVGLLWRHRKQGDNRPDTPHPEQYFSAVVAGFRYVRHAPLLRLVLLRMIGFILPATAAPALFAFIARQQWEIGPGVFGVHMGAYGMGAVAAASLVPRIRLKFSLRGILLLATGLFVAFGILLAWLPPGLLMFAVMPLGGAGWMLAVSTLNASAQATAARWVKGRALSFNLLCFQGSVAIGAILWGTLANGIGVAPALSIAMTTLAIGGILLHRFDLEAIKQLDLTPAKAMGQANEHAIGVSTFNRQQATVVSVTYRIKEEDRQAFLAGMVPLAKSRQRTGAYAWELVEAVEASGVFEERFHVPNWEEHLRQHERVTASDLRIKDAVNQYHIGPEPPEVKHWVKI